MILIEYTCRFSKFNSFVLLSLALPVPSIVDNFHRLMFEDKSNMEGEDGDDDDDEEGDDDDDDDGDGDGDGDDDDD